jgi:uncharacterized protein YdaT
MKEWWLKDETNNTECKLTSDRVTPSENVRQLFGDRLYLKEVSEPTIHNDWIPIAKNNKMTIAEEIQESLDDYTLKTDEELVDDLMQFGSGETEFHTADIERLIREKRLLEEKVESLLEHLDTLKEWIRITSEIHEKESNERNTRNRT